MYQGHFLIHLTCNNFIAGQTKDSFLRLETRNKKADITFQSTLFPQRKEIIYKRYF